MFSIIISEKGGAERREAYDRTEINVGRVQGNDLMLPKGNVSKRHARLLYRDGRFIVTDLKSTNGTYVNGRKIAQATIVREGDKIYIGDFVLRIEAPPGAVAATPSMHPIAAEEPNGEVSAHDSNSSSSQSNPSSAEKALGRASLPRIEAKIPGQEVISHFPLEHDPDDSVPAYAVPGPPRIPSPRPGVPRQSALPPADVRSPLPSGVSSGSFARTTSPSVGVAVATANATQTPPPIYGAGPTHMPAAPSIMPASPGIRRAIPPISDRAERPQDLAQLTARRGALAMLVERVTEASSDLSSLASGGPIDEAVGARLDKLIAEKVSGMKADGELPTDLDPELLAADARRELLGLGPLQALLEDEDVSEIQVFRHDFVVAMHGRRQVPSEVAFTSEASLMRAVRRLCHAAGSPLGEDERQPERRLPSRARMFAVLPPMADQGHVVLIRKPQRADLTLDDLVRSGTISRAMAGLLAQCVGARGNILVTGSVGSGTTSLIGALAAAGSTEDRVVVLQEDDELIFTQPHTLSILLGDTAAEGGRAVRSAARVHPDRLVVGAFAGHVAAEVIDAIGDGADGVLAAARAPTLRQAVLRITADLAATRPGLGIETSREWLASSFDVAIEIARLRDGRHRVLRVAELAAEAGCIAIRDIFSFMVERTAAGGAVEGFFHPTGTIPRIVEDLAARGMSVDTSIFRRHPPR